MSNVIVLVGGRSDEREVSLRSGTAVAKALGSRAHTVTIIDPVDGLMSQLSKIQEADVVFPALHGVSGEDGALQTFLEEHDIRYVGSDSKASSLCFNKTRYTELLAQHNILVPETELVDLLQYKQSGLVRKPFVLKPYDGGSSIDTLIIRDPVDADRSAIEQVFSRHEKLLLQELISGVEITVAILGSKALPVIEIIPPPGGEFDYENKYNGRTQELCPPLHVEKTSQEQAQLLVKQIHELTGCRDMSRTDIIVAKDDKQYVLETNTIPGLTDESLLPKAAAAAGYDMPTLCDELVKAALARKA